MDKRIKKIADWIRAENIRSENLQIVLDGFTGSNHNQFHEYEGEIRGRNEVLALLKEEGLIDWVIKKLV